MKKIGDYIVGPASELKAYLDDESGLPVPFNDDDIPSQFRPLIPLIRIWGIGDDVLRDSRVETAPVEERRELVQGMEHLYPGLVNWLGGDEAQKVQQTDAYHALSCLSYAFELAAVIESESGA
ncbi:hypothetical protein [Deinococcus aestuarii]|uniref:hypothetical protein n=1 Tax=Deinococcus aestuarii TaxID=2774531 RepID=UPI001C0BC0AE|nr:hypothetical protein [Deinococcus aestuarii]